MPHPLIRPALACLAVLWCVACQRSPAPAADAVAPAGPSTAALANQPDAAGADEALLQDFLAAQPEQAEACFAELPVPDATAVSVRPEGPASPSGVHADRVVLAIDASGSMAARAGAQTKMDVARDAATRFLAQLPPAVEVGVVAFGHRGSNRDADRAASCAAVEPVVALSPQGRGQAAAALDAVQARGWTPLADAITAAGRQLGPGDGGRAVYVVSDGKDTCDGDPIAAARALHEGGTRAVVNIVGFDLPAADRAELEAVARAGGGTFTEVALEESLSDVLARQNRNFSAGLRASNRNFATRLKNSNRTGIATLELGNCVGIRSLKAGNRLHAWATERGLDDARIASLRKAFDADEARMKARVAELTAQANAATEAANRRIEAVQADNERAMAPASR